MWDGMTLIPGRECGPCTVCCTAPSINKPEIQKLSGAACRHCDGGGCAIYDSRPPVCRAFYCAWRTVDIFGEDWRPDKSGVLAYVETEGISEDFDLSTGIGLMLVRELIERHGSHLRIESEPGKGSRFFFYLPLWQEPSEGSLS